MKFYWLQTERRYVSTQADANNSGDTWKRHDIPTDHDGLKAFLNHLHLEFAEATKDRKGTDSPDFPETVEIATADSNPDKGGEPSIKHTAPTPPAPSYAERSVAFDQAFEALPVAHQLTLACLALENARSAIRPLPAA